MMAMIEKYLSYLRYERNYSSHTEISYYTDLMQFKDFVYQNCTETTLMNIDGDIIRMWIMYLINKETSPRSVNRKLSALKCYYRYLIKQGLISKNPTQHIHGPKTNKKIPSFVSHSDIESTLLNKPVSNTFIEIRNKAIIEVFYITGIRRAELIGLKNNDIDLNYNTIRVNGKRNKQRLIPFSEKTKELLEHYISERNKTLEKQSDSFFVKKNGKPIYPMLVYRIVHENLKWIPTLTKASPHSLRHSFATNMLNNGAEINAVKELLGHSSLASTEIYTHTSLEELKKNYKKAHPRA